MPMSEDFYQRLAVNLPEIVGVFKTPFHIYDEKGILETGKRLKAAFSNIRFREYFAVKANPNPEILKLMQLLGFGFDCSSVPELLLARDVGAQGSDIMFTSNNTSMEEFEAADANKCVLNLDDITLVDKVPHLPGLICFRYNPGERRTGNDIIGDPVNSKYGVSHSQIVDAYRLAQKRGAVLFGLHTMVASNELNHSYMVETVKMLLGVCQMISDELDITFAFINMGGGIGIPYKTGQEEVDIFLMAKKISELLDDFARKNGYMPKLLMESGRYITGPHGALVTTCINQKHTYREYRGVDASMSALMRPAVYDAYHHITVFGKENAESEGVIRVVGALCENWDQFTASSGRELPPIEEGELVIIQDTGAHGHAMGFNYNGRLRPKELMFRSDGTVELIRREEIYEDYISTLKFTEKVFTP